MAHQVTITGQIGPALLRTAAVIPNVIEVIFVPDSKLIRVKTSDAPPGQIKDFDVSAATTVTCTITAGSYAFVVS